MFSTGVVTMSSFANRAVVGLQGYSYVLQQGRCEAGFACASHSGGGRPVAGTQPLSGRSVQL